MNSIDTVLGGLRAAAESTRLRLLSLCADGELTVTELTGILGQSQPRVSRHLKRLCEAGLLERHQEGSWVFYRLAQRSDGAAFARTLVEMVPADDAVLALDRRRLDGVKQGRAARAALFFDENAARWSEVRKLYVPEPQVEAKFIEILADLEVDDLLDIGTGTGRILELMAPRIGRGIGIDLSHAMLGVARVNLEQPQLRNCSVRQGDMYNLPFAGASFDAVAIHMVLHYADNPTTALAEAARVIRPGGRLVVIDFAPHRVELLRDKHAHRRLGFADSEVGSWFEEVGLETRPPVHLAGDPLTVVLWAANRSNVTQLALGRAAAAGGRP
ncbi:MAG: metalloregulator ArsR/SmtB family transcription factor [Alphaproteobacteria bacterium]|jgi:ArsR family transcriptional regulator|nr:metalloregulator ArsR/SmtB family transcription factor [Alphaproteobacteria bacterium]MDP6517169.1 metalloregulator ArsR/SmtB family transcription factor [Alphaproteobacteria bacterium]